MSPTAARPLSFLRNGGAAGAPVPTPASVPPAPVVMDDLPPSAARPLSFLRNGGAQPSSAPAPMPLLEGRETAPLAHDTGLAPAPHGAGASTSATEAAPVSPGPTVRITNMRRPEPEGPPEPQPYDDEADERLFPEEGSAEGCASGECIPSEEPAAFTPEPTAPLTSTSSAFTPTGHASASEPAAFVPSSNEPPQAPTAFTPAPTAPASTAFVPSSPVAAPTPAAFAPPGPSTGAQPVSTASTPPAAFTPAPSPAARTPAPAAIAPPRPFAPPPAALEPEPPEPEPPPAAAPVASGRDNPNRSLPERWRAAVDSVKSTSVRHGTALANGRLLSMKAGEIILGFPPSAAFHKAAVTAAAGKATVDAALASHFGRPVKLTIQDVAQAQEAHGLGMSISEQDSHSRATHEKSTEGKVRGHPSVRAILKMLGGEIEHIQVYEPERPAAVLTDIPAAPED
ncbi:DNA polymerase III subunit gamma/tau [Corallococcus sp. BB11-1]|uniref:DNA polymerase III subunit gamma/tau n=1 Tax=Corallococcus sp. BB11-1 TaxID=2996783 RepID=UPI0022717548|nr:DNA polymerase III subunit gamma/tau [Corallococcus sp. BB11-1]MCY1033187.1 DNA polymerase III subunit gamma/tau [Corallococcus sp. BB11-1]